MQLLILEYKSGANFLVDGKLMVPAWEMRFIRCTDVCSDFNHVCALQELISSIDQVKRKLYMLAHRQVRHYLENLVGHLNPDEASRDSVATDEAAEIR